MIEAVKSFFIKSSGILLLNKQGCPNDLNDYYNEVVGDFEMKVISEDKKNMKSDASKLKTDLKKSVAAYNSEMVNG